MSSSDYIRQRVLTNATSVIIPFLCGLYTDNACFLYPLCYLGVPDDLVKRAAYVLEMTESDKPIERLDSHSISDMDRRYKVM